MEIEELKEIAIDMAQRCKRGPKLEEPKREDCKDDEEYKKQCENHELNKTAWSRCAYAFLEYTLLLLPKDVRRDVLKELH